MEFSSEDLQMRNIIKLFDPGYENEVIDLIKEATRNDISVIECINRIRGQQSSKEKIEILKKTIKEKGKN